MRKLLSCIFAIMLSISVLPTLVACDKPQDPEEPEAPVFSEEYLFDDEYHWRPQINGSEVVDYAKHYNPAGLNAGKCKCGYYFPCVNLIYEKTTINGVDGYELVGYDEYTSPYFYHVEVPTHYQGEDDSEPLPVISVGAGALSNRSGYGKCPIKIKSVKLHEGLLNLGVNAFSNSDLTECVVPNSVISPLSYTFFNCTSLKKLIIGNGVPKLNSWVIYYSTMLEEVVIGNSVTEIAPNNFYGMTQLKYVVLPASLISLPEYIYERSGEIGVRFEAFVNCGSFNIFIDKTFDEVEELTYEPTLVSDATLDTPRTTYGYARGWNTSGTTYYKGQWHYGPDGIPVING